MVGSPGRLRRGYRRLLAWVRRHVPPGLRLVLGILVMIGGVFGFLPVLGFWMIPLGAAIAALDVKPLWMWLTGRRTWLGRELWNNGQNGARRGNGRKSHGQDT